MIKFAPVAPLSIHHELSRVGMLGDYHLLLAHQVMSEPYAYANFWQRQEAFVIMDNSAAEFGESIEWQTVLEAAKLCDADFVVLPDKIGDFTVTINNAARYIDTMPYAMKPLGVAQGRTFDEVRVCAEGLVELGCEMISIPRGVTYEIGSRMELVAWFSETYPDIPLHLLGFSNDILDDIASAMSSPSVMGIDSAVPLWLPHILPPNPPRDADFGKRPEDYDRWQELPLRDISLTNLGLVRWWLTLGDARDVLTQARARSVPEDLSTAT